MEEEQKPLTFTYSAPNGQPLDLDVYLPPVTASTSTAAPLPACIFFHGGGLLRGERTNVLHELKDDLIRANFAFISPSYRLLIPCTGFDLLADLDALFHYVHDTLNSHLAPHTPLRVSTRNVFAAGHSGGAYLALQSGLVMPPSRRPRGVLLVSAQGGNLLHPAYFRPRDPQPNNKQQQQQQQKNTQQKNKQQKPAGQKWEKGYEKYLDPSHPEYAAIPQSAGYYHSYTCRTSTIYTGSKKVGEANWRASAPGMVKQRGRHLDVLTGVAGLGRTLESAWDAGRRTPAELAQVLPGEVRVLFPELMIGAERSGRDKEKEGEEEREEEREEEKKKEGAREEEGRFPDLWVVHGTGDKTVRCEESQCVAEMARRAGSRVREELVGNWGHGWSANVYERAVKAVVDWFRERVVEEVADEERKEERTEGGPEMEAA